MWDAGAAAGLSPLGVLTYRSRLLGSDRAVANYGGGNTSAKAWERDHTGNEIEVLWVKGSGSDLATISESGFTGLRLAEIRPLMERDAMTDEDMVAYLARCQLEPTMPRSSIETLLHAFIPFPHVDHTHADATNMICCAARGEELAHECFGDTAAWIPYIRPGFTLSKQVGEAVRDHPGIRAILLAKHGLVTWGQTAAESYQSTIEVINQAARFVADRSGGRPDDPVQPAFGGQGRAPLPATQQEELLAAILPTLRGAVSPDDPVQAETPKILVTDTSPEAMTFVTGKDSGTLSQVGAACPDHLVHTKMRPLWIDFDPQRDSVADLKERLCAGVATYRDVYVEYFNRNQTDGDRMMDPNPRVVLIEGLGLVGVGKDYKAATLSRDLYHRAINVIAGASALDTFVSLTEEESYAVEYWPLEQYKLTLAPPPKELAGQIALITGGAGGIGSAIGEALAAAGACVVVTDLDTAGAEEVAQRLGGRSAGMDVRDETAVAAAFRTAILAYGGVDIVIANAGLASSAPVEETTVEMWENNHAVLTRGYFLTAREAFRLLKDQGISGSIVFVVSKNALAAGKNATAYSSAKAAELHLARCLAEEGGAAGIRVNVVNPDAVLQGSKIWDSSWKEERAQAYGVAPDQLDEYYRQRTTLKVNVFPEDIAQAVLFFASRRRSAKTTGNILNVDGGVASAYPR
jgi:rhamnulose-1-phosphate aldolase/alcohol dehydrogenase